MEDAYSIMKIHTEFGEPVVDHLRHRQICVHKVSRGELVSKIPKTVP